MTKSTTNKSAKNINWKMILLSLYFVCGVLGTIAFVMHFTNDCQKYESEPYRRRRSGALLRHGRRGSEPDTAEAVARATERDAAMHLTGDTGSNEMNVIEKKVEKEFEKEFEKKCRTLLADELMN